MFEGGAGPGPLTAAGVLRLRRLAVLGAFIASLLGCNEAPAPGTPSEHPRVQLTGEVIPPWETASPADVGIDESALQRAMAGLPDAAEHGLRSMLVVRHGKLVFERYWNGSDANTLQDTMSVTKSITSMLLGIAIDRGLVGGLGEPMMKTLAVPYPELAERHREVTLEHLLLMQSGVDCDDQRPGTAAGHAAKMVRGQDRLRLFLELPRLHRPGTVTAYCSGDALALGRVIELASGQRLPQFAQQHLWAPLGITHAQWGSFDNGHGTDTAAHLALRSRDMARIGQLVLQQGQWQGRQLVSREWLARSTREHTRINRNKPYGYLWWMDRVPAEGGAVPVVFAVGSGGQMIFVVPELALVTVFTGANFNSRKVQRTHQLLRRVAAASGRAQSPILQR